MSQLCSGCRITRDDNPNATYNHERGDNIKFEDKFNRYQGGLTQAYEQLLEARKRDALQDEIIKDLILTDTVLFDRLAQVWLDDPTNREGFLDAAVKMVKSERQPPQSADTEAGVLK